MINFIFNDGGRASSGFRGKADDCVVRAIAIATQQNYKLVYDEINERCKTFNAKKKKSSSSRTGVFREVYEQYLKEQNFVFVSKMSIGSGCTTHLRADELPSGVVICRLSRHIATVIDGTLHDTHDSSRNGSRCVYGYFIKQN